ncbi:MAG: penicillin-binding protein [bacterium]|nr:penicillin-binding protein [bacterium]
MTNFYYYSNWNKHNRRGPIKKFFDWVLKLPLWIINKLQSDKKLRRRVFKLSFYAAFALFIFLGITFVVVSLSLPDPNKLNARIIPQSTKIYARDGETLLYEVHGEARRTLVELDEIPDYVKNATISIEEKNFYQNRGIDFKGILRSLFKNITRGELRGVGGSTITQQFVKNAILTNEKTFTRKIKEAILAIQIEQRFSKDEILKLYLNEIPYGQNAYGIEAASQTYFSKSAKDLTLAEAAYLVSLPQAPTFYSPNGPNRQRLDARHEFVLREMREEKYITSTQLDQALVEIVEFNKIKDIILAPHFVLYVQSLLAEKYGEKTLEEGGLEVVTTLDYDLQQIAESAVDAGVKNNRANHRAENAALVAIDPRTGQIISMVGSRNFFDEEYDGQVNIALRERQPGSSIKPYVYAAGFKEGMSPATMLVDVQTVFGTAGGQNYAPLNYDGANHGLLSARQALAGSLNISAVKMLALTGVQDAINTMKDLGITANLTTDRCGLSLVLGGCEISLLDHTSAMGVFANGGIRHEPTTILKVTDSDGKVLEEYKEDQGKEAIDPQVAYEIANIMSDNSARSFIFGTNSRLVLPGRAVAAKTGTTQQWREGWTVGYTPSLSAGVWVGNNDFSPMRPGAGGITVAAPIWNQFMREALAGTPAETFAEPTGIQHVLVDEISGKLPTEYTPTTKTEIFADFAVPTEFDDVHVPIKVNTLNGLRATDQTPPELVETRVYTIIHSEMPENSDWENPVRAWASASGYNLPPTQSDDGSANNGSLSPNISFVTPGFNQEITKLPIQVQVGTNGSGINSVELVLEGKSIGSRGSAPYNFNIESAENGWQTLTAIARLANNKSIETNTRIYININN